MHECKNAKMQERTRLKRAASALVHSCIFCILALVVSACASAQAKGAVAGPPLDVPAPPSRVVEPIVAEAPTPLPLPEDPRPTPVRPVRPAAAPAPASAARPEAARPDAPAAEAPKADEPPKPPTTLQTTTAAAEGEVERGIRATLTRAAADLGRINYRALNAEAKRSTTRPDALSSRLTKPFARRISSWQKISPTRLQESRRSRPDARQKCQYLATDLKLRHNILWDHC